MDQLADEGLIVAYTKEEKAAYDKARQERLKNEKATYDKARRERLKTDIAVKKKAYYDANKDRLRFENLDQKRAWRRQWHHRNKERSSALTKKFYAAHREAILARAKEVSASRVSGLVPGYVAAALQISVADLTPELLELKREQLTLHRLAKSVKQHLKETK